MGCQFMPQSYAAPKSISWLLAVFIMLLSETAFPAKIVELSVQGGIGPATADYLIRGIDKAQGAELIILKIDTPGGLDKSMRQIVKSILTSETPVVVYVAPSGARAASAGTYLLYAGTLAAMAPGTHLGAASPVSIGGGMGEDAKDKQSVMNQKITQDAVAYIRTLAQLRGRDPDFAEKAVLNAETLTADEALRKKVINYIADNRQHLLSQLHGVTVVQDGRQVKLNTRNANVVDLKPDWRMRFLLVITDPTIAYLLLLLGIYGIFFELMNPGFIAPGVIGAIAMLLALYALQLLPVNYAGLGLILLGVIFIVAEAFVPSFGVLGFGGTVAFLVGSILLIDTEHEGYQIAWSAIWAMAAANVLFFIVLLSMLVRSRRKPVRHGTEALLGAQGRTLEPINLQGQAVIHGEIWHVQSKKPIGADKTVIVVGADGLTLKVEEIQGA
ncbi:transmembrane protein [Legionella londiniensis]|uniref:Transmembrane protein n=2 Tax=Legionella londiniensis TaxID=45068 RepID=A0A0W0VHG6_9GAMM|nr:transmembrane protein [Legionella londiniensis]STX92185.1 transmembrane protein [Legionella londiniensis]